MWWISDSRPTVNILYTLGRQLHLNSTTDSITRSYISNDIKKPYVNSASTSSKWSKNPLNNFTPNPGSKFPTVARIECIDSCGNPASIARMPIALDSIGPTVPPLLESFLIWKTCNFESHLSATRCRKAVLTLSVVVCPFGSAWTAIPTLRRGAWFSR